MKFQGELAELEFYRLAYSKGMVVSKPFGDNAKYDFIVDANGKLSRAQVKSVAGIQRDTHSQLSSYRVLIAHGGKSKRKYTPADIDIVAVYVIPGDTWYLIPIEAIKTLRISLYPLRKISSHSSKWARYEQFQEEWLVFYEYSCRDHLPPGDTHGKATETNLV